MLPSDDSHLTFIRLMTALDMSPAQLIDKICDYRWDGKKTSRATINRWINGETSVDPFAIAWMTEKLRSKIINEKIPLLDWGFRDRVRVGVASLTGGAGVTTLSRNLNHVSRYFYNIDSNYYEVIDGVKFNLMKELGHLDGSQINIDECDAFEIDRNSISFFDIDTIVTQRMCSEKLKGNLEGVLNLDLIVIPGRFDNWKFSNAARSFLKNSLLGSMTRLVYMTSGNRINFNSIDHDLMSNITINTVISGGDDSWMAAAGFGERLEFDIMRKSLYSDVLEDILHVLGVIPFCKDDRESIIDNMLTKELLNVYERAGVDRGF